MSKPVTNDNGILRFEFTEDKFGARPKSEDGVLASLPMHDCGHVGLISTYGSDDFIVDAARVSYGKGTERKRNNLALIRYLLRHKHTSPFEQSEVSFYLKMPMFTAVQQLRHRTANVNQYSARYSELDAEFYVPNRLHLGSQALDNKQGRQASLFSEEEAERVQSEMVAAQQQGFDAYERLLKIGVSRELARIVTPAGTYTQMYWKCDLHNFMHFLKLRMDIHAQREIREFATAMYDMVKPHFPITFAAFDDYILNSYTLSALERKMLGDILRQHVTANQSWPANTYGMSDREYADAKLFFDTTVA